jgi:DNA repair protein RecO (recombination protein O)
MRWSDEGYLLSKNNISENSIIIEAFTLKHGKYSGIVYGGSSRRQKSNFQIGNKILLNYISKGENRSGYFNIELIKPVAPLFFDDKRRSVCILAATSILKILLPERQVNEKIYSTFDNMLMRLELENWINSYIYWELSLIKDLGFESVSLKSNGFKSKYTSKQEIKAALVLSKNLLIKNFILPNKLKFPFFRNVLENYYT